MSYTEHSLVEVLIKFYDAGDREFSSWFKEEADICSGQWEDHTRYDEDVLESVKANEVSETQSKAEGKQGWLVLSKGFEPDLIVTQPIQTYNFTCIGQNFEDCFHSYIDNDAFHQMGCEYIFGRFLSQLEEIGRKIVHDKQAAGLHIDGKTVRFVTLWTYSAWQDSYYKEWDSEWALVGLVKLDNYTELEVEPIDNA